MRMSFSQVGSVQRRDRNVDARGGLHVLSIVPTSTGSTLPSPAEKSILEQLRNRGLLNIECGWSMFSFVA